MAVGLGLGLGSACLQQAEKVVDQSKNNEDEQAGESAAQIKQIAEKNNRSVRVKAL